MNRINLLPKWVLPDSIPSVYDCESGSWVEMAAKVYGAIRELQGDYNVFAEEINKAVNDYIESDKKDQEAFKEEIRKIVHDYIRMIDEKIKLQDLNINQAISYMKDNLSQSLNAMLQEMKDLGEFDDAVLNSLSSIETSINAINTEIAGLKTNVATNTNDIADLQMDVTELKNNKPKYIYDENSKTLNLRYIENEVIE